MSMRVRMVSGWQQNIERGLNAGLLELVTDIHRRALLLAPIDKRNLVASGIIELITGGYQIKFGSAKVPYARRRHFENKKNPQTVGYLDKAGESVARGDKVKYFRGKV